jgi:hypothetical protein
LKFRQAYTQCARSFASAISITFSINSRLITSFLIRKASCSKSAIKEGSIFSQANTLSASSIIATQPLISRQAIMNEANCLS